MEQENKQAGFYYYSAADRYIIDTQHFIDRFYDKNRFNQQAGSEDLYLSVFKTIRAGIDQIMTKYGDREGSYLIHSKSRLVSVVLYWGYPRGNFPYKNYKNRRNAHVITILPLKTNPHKKNPSDVMVTVASVGGDFMVIKKGDSFVTDMILVEV